MLNNADPMRARLPMQMQDAGGTTLPQPQLLAFTPPPLAPAAPSFPLLPPQTGPPRITLVLDLDRTLIDCIMLQEPSLSEPDFL